MSFGDLYSLYYRNIDLLLRQMNVPERDRSKYQKQIHEGLKTYFGVDSMAKLSAYDRWEYVSKCEVLLTREYGLDPLPEQKELKFKDIN